MSEDTCVVDAAVVRFAIEVTVKLKEVASRIDLQRQLRMKAFSTSIRWMMIHTVFCGMAGTRIFAGGSVEMYEDAPKCFEGKVKYMRLPVPVEEEIQSLCSMHL